MVFSIANLSDDVLGAMNDGKVTLATFIDLRKAFDTVNHKVLLKKLKHIGISSTVLNWCVSYIYGRSQKTVANGVTSDSREVTYGVPQGSFLGPLFFLAYIIGMSNAVKDVKLSLYADDTVLYVCGDDIRTCTQSIQVNLDRFSNWCHLNALKINSDKTKFLIFGRMRN